MKTAKKQNMGFSLMELMVTVAILGIIAGIAVPNYFQYVENTRLTQVRTVMAQIQQEVQRVKLVNGSLGEDSAAVVDTVQGILDSDRIQGLINENDLGRFYDFEVVEGSHTGQYFFDAAPMNTSKRGLYMDQSGNAFKCPDAGSVSSHTGCDSM